MATDSVRIIRVSAAVLLLTVSHVGWTGGSEQLIYTGTEYVADAALLDAITAYYEAEKSADWSAAYKLRAQDFRRLIPFDKYRKKMNTGMSGWSLLKVEILGSKTLGINEMAVQIRFHAYSGGKRTAIPEQSGR